MEKAMLKEIGKLREQLVANLDEAIAELQEERKALDKYYNRYVSLGCALAQLKNVRDGAKEKGGVLESALEYVFGPDAPPADAPTFFAEEACS